VFEGPGEVLVSVVVILLLSDFFNWFERLY
jgi:hypothetical protein